MSDIFREVDEEVRLEKLNAFWKRFGTGIVTLVLLAIAAVGGWRYHQHNEELAAAASAAQFEDALALARQDKSEQAEKAFSALSTDAAGGYKMLARFRAAAEISKRDPAAAVKAYDALAADGTLGPTLQDLAKIRAAAILVDTVSADELLGRIGSLVAPGQAWRHSARELLGLARFKAGDLKTAAGYFEELALDPDVPPQLRQRAEILIALVRGGVVPIK